MSEKFIGKVHESFYLQGSFGCLIVFRLEESAIVKVGDKIKLQTPENEIVATSIREIPMISRRFKDGQEPDFSLISIGLQNTERNKQGFPPETEIYLLEN